MRKIFVRLSIIGVVAAIAISGTVAYFYDVETSAGNTFSAGTMDLKTIDWDELTWRDGVTATWKAIDMKPGDEFPFTIEFVGLGRRGTITPDHLEITCDYSINENGCLEPETNCANSPDDIAKQMIIIGFLYAGGDYLPSITDVDGDGKKTFYDLKQAKVDNLPIPPVANGANFFRLSVKFNELAGNDFQGDTFDLTMIFKLNQDASQ
jgi:predicted ribosomally synthesized peptide with SipW-like signal peptide